ncbi:MAG: MBL fold metallo-hydrolase [Rhodospirillaceae bacterium]|jgi:phosphoribosyl 1,2-cyclic phosphate phosphodiesterase|nr:MBL fold metallo-hydrolase [Rhodospirillaceae bacterium]MBT5245039.1 MBL fold metallo-hydrolase [Rhodospirillaceae bacterium]MBT5561075.1 MBL fold metallo-hydrolase [Rhodospirillaceae bacterium]MBT6242767.1 MBL fold metallo-hydrolase [Rhodospirillaceae bacterium]
MKVTILGCGGSSGTPAVGRGWGKCDPNNPKNSRLRPSILVENGDTCLLVDTSPDLRQQLLNADVKRLDSVLFTHYHADHLHGIDDLRQINREMNAAIDVYADADTLRVIDERFGYVLEPLAENADMYYKPTLVPHELNDGDALGIGDIDIQVFTQDHGFCDTLGFRFGPIAYTTDVVELPDRAFEILKGVDTWIIGTLIDHPHPTHAHVDKALGWIDRIDPRRGVLSHLGYGFDYDTLNKRLPDHVEPAFDGMILEA